MIHRFALIGLCAAALIAPAAAQELRPRATSVQAPAAQVTTLEGAARTAALGRVNQSLNGVQRLQGRFVQTSPGGGRATGMFYMQRPGQLRFEYDAPATMLIVSDGSVVSLRDTALRTTDRTPLRSTPLNLILGARIDLERNARVMRVTQSGDWTMVTARDRSGQMDGQITLNFFGPNAELRSWDVIDATGARTRIALSDITRPPSFDRGLFQLEDMLENRRSPRR